MLTWNLAFAVLKAPKHVPSILTIEKGDSGTMMSDEEIMLNFEVLMVAGSQTTATLLSGVTFQLLKNPDALKKLGTGI